MRAVARVAVLTLATGLPRVPLAAQAGWEPPRLPCEFVPANSNVDKGIQFLRGAAEKPDQRDPQLAQAKKSLTDALVQDKQGANPAVWYYLGRYYVAVGDVAGADTALGRAATLAAQGAGAPGGAAGRARAREPRFHAAWAHQRLHRAGASGDLVPIAQSSGSEARAGRSAIVHPRFDGAGPGGGSPTGGAGRRAAAARGGLERADQRLRPCDRRAQGVPRGLPGRDRCRGDARDAVRAERPRGSGCCGVRFARRPREGPGPGRAVRAGHAHGRAGALPARGPGAHARAREEPVPPRRIVFARRGLLPAARLDRPATDRATAACARPSQPGAPEARGGGVGLPAAA